MTYGTVLSAGQCWLDRNLGALFPPGPNTILFSQGDLFQWGRGTDGHQDRTSLTTANLSNLNLPGHGNFILAPNSPFDWRIPQNVFLWQGATGTNNPCPLGFRVPTDSELNVERLSWSSNNVMGAFSSPLKLTAVGNREFNSGTITGVETIGLYWSSTVNGNHSNNLYFDSGYADISNYNRAYGMSLRCIKD